MPTQKRFGASALKSRCTRPSRRWAVGSDVVVRHGLPRRLAPWIPAWRFLAPGKAAGIPGYTCCMAKVMVSLPDDLLAEVDAEAQRGGTTRSAVMRGFADAALRRRREDRAAAMRSLLSDASPHGGRAAELVKATRPGP